jgi:hypothetical protein
MERVIEAVAHQEAKGRKVILRFDKGDVIIEVAKGTTSYCSKLREGGRPVKLLEALVSHAIRRTGELLDHRPVGQIPLETLLSSPSKDPPAESWRDRPSLL